MGKRRVAIGDVVEIKTRKGLAYALYTHSDEQWGAVIRVFETTYPVRPVEFQTIVNGPVQFTTFFPLGAAVWRGIFEVVAQVEIPESLKKFPVFLSQGLPDTKTGKISRWGLWDGKTKVTIHELTPEMYSFPKMSIVNDTRLIERIESNWHHEDDPADGVRMSKLKKE